MLYQMSYSPSCKSQNITDEKLSTLLLTGLICDRVKQGGGICMHEEYRMTFVFGDEYDVIHHGCR